jgi:hypothetical protein
VRSGPRLYNEEQLRLRDSLETAVRKVRVVRQSPVHKRVNTEAEEATALERKPLPGDDRCRHSRLIRVSACCGEL